MKIPNPRKNFRISSQLADKITQILFILYLMVLTWILLFKLGTRFSFPGNSRSINLIPFGEPLILNGKIDFGENILNALIFIPLGIYTEILFAKWTILKKIGLFFTISFLIETLQFILGNGASDVTDILNNTLGGILGLLFYLGVEKIFKNRMKAQKFINFLASIFTVVILLFLFLLKTNRLWLRYQ